MSSSQSLEQEHSPILTIDLKKCRIRIYKQTLHLLDDPEYIQFLVKPDKRILAVRPGTPKDISPQKIYWKTLTDKKQCCEFYSKSLIAHLRQLINTQTGDYTYKVVGSINDIRNRVFFDLSQSEVINEEAEAVTICK